MNKSVYSVCGMCTVRCPIKVNVKNGLVDWIEGNPNDPGMAGRLCAKGSAGISMLYDYERPRRPLIRKGKRGEGNWQEVSWDEALDYIAEKMKAIIEKFGPRAIALSDRGGPFRDIQRSFLRALGSPNYINHDCTCARNTQHASISLFGSGRKTFNYDYKQCKHLVLYGRNVFESLRVKNAGIIMEMLDRGGKITYIDVRASGTAMKADRFLKVRPGTDYALNLGLIHVILKEKLYDSEFVAKWVDGLDELHSFIQPYTPEWAAQETGVSAEELKRLAFELSEDSPSVIFHPGWMTARYLDSFYSSRTAYILNVLMGSLEAPGGLFFQKGPKDAGRKGLKNLLDTIPKPEEKRADGCGWKHKHFDAGPGLLQLFYQAVLTEEPYPVKGYFVYRHNPLLSLPDPEEQKKALDKMDLLVAIETNYSETAWYCDVILPAATYLERASVLAGGKGLKPSFRIREQAVEPQAETKSDWWIFKSLAEKLEIKDFLKFENIEEFWNWQLEDTGVTIEDLKKTGSVTLCDEPIWWDRMNDLKFKTPSGKIEIISSKLEENGFPSLKPYQSPDKPKKGMFRLAFGRSPVHTHGTTQNNPYLHEIMSENTLWMNDREAEKLNIKNNDVVEVISADGSHTGKIKVWVSEFTHPEVVYMAHGFGRKVPWQTRGYDKGLSDYRFETGMLYNYDQVGGGIALLEAVVQVKKAS